MSSRPHNWARSVNLWRRERIIADTADFPALTPLAPSCTVLEAGAELHALQDEAKDKKPDWAALQEEVAAADRVRRSFDKGSTR